MAKLKLKIKKGDTVAVIAGKDKGKSGKVLAVLPREERALVSGINVVKKHMKPNKSSQGGIILKEMSIHISNLSHIDPASKALTKVYWKLLDNGKKVRIAKRSGEIII